MTKETTKRLGDQLRRARTRRGHSRMDVAERVDLSARTIHSLEANDMHQRVSYLTYLKVSDYLSDG